MKKCELCKLPARTFCESDQASLCWDCDSKVHGANFLVERHSRTLLCHACQSHTPWKASGAKLGNTLSLCERCAGGTKIDDEQDQEEESEGDNDDDIDTDDEEDDEDDDDDDDEVDDEDGDNQVVPWSSTALPPPPSSSNSDDSISKRNNSDEVTSQLTASLKRCREDNDFQVSNSKNEYKREKLEQQIEFLQCDKPLSIPFRDGEKKPQCCRVSEVKDFDMEGTEHLNLRLTIGLP